jgi:hypothetical protein
MLKLDPMWDPLRGDPRFEENRRLARAEKKVKLKQAVLRNGARST